MEQRRPHPAADDDSGMPIASEGGEPDGRGGGWWERHRFELVRDVTIAVLILIAGFVWDDRMADRSERAADRISADAEVLENTRYVRSLSSQSDTPRPFGDMNLKGAILNGLDLSCDEPAPDFDPLHPEARAYGNCAYLWAADLRGASLRATQFDGAILAYADLSDADLNFTDFTNAQFVGTKLRGASIDVANFAGATFDFMDLRGVDLSKAVGLDQAHFPDDLCYDKNTRWPKDFEPPSVRDSVFSPCTWFESTSHS